MSGKKINFNINKVSKHETNNGEFERIVDNFVKKGVLNEESREITVESTKHIVINDKSIQRTSVYVPKEMHLELKIIAAKQNMSMNDVIMEAIRRYLK